MNFRLATEADHEQILELYRLTTRRSGGIARTEVEITPEYVMANTRKALTENGLIMVATLGNDLVGEMHAHQYGIRIFRHILTNATVVVHPDFQNKGVGKQLLAAFWISSGNTVRISGGLNWKRGRPIKNRSPFLRAVVSSGKAR